MKHTNFLVIFTIAVMLLFSSCEESKPTLFPVQSGVNSAFNGTWNCEQAPVTVVLNNGSYLMLEENNERIKGTYSTSGSTMTTANLQISGAWFAEEIPGSEFSASQWYTEQQFWSLMEKYIIDELVADGMSQTEAQAEASSLIKSMKEGTDGEEFKELLEPRTYTLSSNSISTTMYGETIAFTKQGTTQAQNTPSTQNVLDVDIDSLTANPVRSKQNYGGKTVRTRGEILSIYEFTINDFFENKDHIQIFLWNGNNSIVVDFNESERSKIVNLDEGQTISVMGVFDDGRIIRAVLID